MSRYAPEDAEVAIRALEEIRDKSIEPGTDGWCSNCCMYKTHIPEARCGIASRALATIRERAGTTTHDENCDTRQLGPQLGPSTKPCNCGVRKPIEHRVKCWPEYYEAVRTGRKPFEVRKDDRDYQEGDDLVLDEWDPKTGRYTGRPLLRMTIGYVARGACIPDGYCVFALSAASLPGEAKATGEGDGELPERCESGCADPVTRHDADGVPLCEKFCVCKVGSTRPGEARPGSREDVEAQLGVRLVPPGSEGEAKATGLVPYPKDWPPHRNGGALCDMLVGPCACGATHETGELKDPRARPGTEPVR